MQRELGRLEAALGVLGESDSSEAQILRDALKQARRSAQEQPISAQIKNIGEFIRGQQTGSKCWRKNAARRGNC